MTSAPAPVAESFAERLAAERPRLLGLARRLVRDPLEAEDAAQEALARAWSRRKQLESAAVAPWLNRILVNLVIDRSRSKRNTLDVAEVEDRWRDGDYTVDPESVLARAELRDELEDGLTRLPVGHRIVVVLHDAAGWTATEIAGALDIGVPAAKARLRRGRMMLVTALDENDPRRKASLAQPMRCWEARRQVSSYLDNELDQVSRHKLETHLADCPTCPRLYAALVGVRQVLSELCDPDSVVPAGLVARLGEGRATSKDQDR